MKGSIKGGVNKIFRNIAAKGAKTEFEKVALLLII
jgi:hypothetical protein